MAKAGIQPSVTEGWEQHRQARMAGILGSCPYQVISLPGLLFPLLNEMVYSRRRYVFRSIEQRAATTSLPSRTALSQSAERCAGQPCEAIRRHPARFGPPANGRHMSDSRHDQQRNVPTEPCLKVLTPRIVKQ